MSDYSQIESERLIFKRPEEGDYAFLRDVVKDDDLMKYVATSITDEQAESVVNRTRAHWERHGFGTYVTFLRSTMERIGFCGPKYLDVEGQDVVDIGCVLMQKYQGQGLATESYRRMLSFSFDTLKFDKISSIVNEDHTAIRRVLEKMGYRHLRNIDRECDGIQFKDECYYEITRSEYLKQ